MIIITGGSVKHIFVELNTDGLTTYEISSRRGRYLIVSAPAGYAGAGFLGAMLVFSGFDILAVGVWHN